MSVGRTAIAKTAVSLLSDSNAATRAASLAFLRKLYTYCGAEFKEWIQSQDIRQSHLKEIMSRLEDARVRGKGH